VNDVSGALELYWRHYPERKPESSSALSIEPKQNPLKYQPSLTQPADLGGHVAKPPQPISQPRSLSQPKPKAPSVQIVYPVDRDSESESEAESDSEAEHETDADWDFSLPRLAAHQDFQPGGVDGTKGFSMSDIISAVQYGASCDQVQEYLAHHSYPNPRTVRNRINDLVKGIPAMFFVTSTNDPWLIRLFAKYGGDVNSQYRKTPLLAFAIINSQTIDRETSASVATLLSFGADATVIPKAFYRPLCQDLPDGGPSIEELDDLADANKQWCKEPEIRALVAETLNLTQRYHLDKSSRIERPWARQRQVARDNGAEDLFGISYFLIGQTVATEMLTKCFLHYMLRNHTDPLVLVFAGLYPLGSVLNS
jgi:hypothetical protein